MNSLNKQRINSFPHQCLIFFLVSLLCVGLAGCGGSSAPNDSLNPPGDITSAPTRVSIEMPAGLPKGAAAYVIGATGAATVTENEAIVEVFADGPQLATVVSADGTPLLMGWIGKDRPAISVQTTAAVLLHFGLGIPFLGPEVRDTLRQRLESHPAVAAFGIRIAELLSVDSKTLEKGSPALLEAFSQAVQLLLPSGAPRRGVKIEPATELSGLRVVHGEAVNNVFVDNIYVRRAVVIVNREAYTDDAGIRHAEPQGPVQVGEVLELPLPKAVDSVSNTVGGWADQYYSPDDPNSFFRSVTDPIALDITPVDAKSTEYSIVTLMAGKLPFADANAFNRLPPSQKEYVRGLDVTKNLMLKTLLIDMAGPYFFEFLSGKFGESSKGEGSDESRKFRKELMQKFAVTLLKVLQAHVPNVIEKLSAGQTDAWTAFKTIGEAMKFNPDTGKMSPLLTDVLVKLAEFSAARLADEKLRSPLLEVATGVKIGGKHVLGILPVLKIIKGSDKVLLGLSTGRVVADVERSREMESWKLTVTKPKVVLLPKPLEVDTTGIYPVKVEIVDNDNDDFGVEKGSISFDWECTGRYGDLYSRSGDKLVNPNRFTTSKNFATTDYLPNGNTPNGEPETITVRAYFEPIGSKGVRQLIGVATSTLKFKKAFSLRITPSTTKMPTDERLDILASIVEPLPKTASVKFQWKLRSGSGDLNIPVADGDTVHSQVSYLSPAEETVAVVEVVAFVTFDPNRPPAVTDPVIATLTVKKGLQKIVMEVGGGAFACNDPKACGVTQYTAFIVPKFSKAISYSAVLSGFTYPGCNRTVIWSAPVGDRGDCNFPVSYFPHTSAGATNSWAVWISFGFPLDGKCVVTITLKP